MLNLVIAELTKATRNRWLFAFTAGLFPLVTTIMFVLFAIAMLVDPTQLGGPVEWITVMEQALAVPGNVIGQVVLMGFAASFFAGESANNTWKSIVPRTRRFHLILAKFIAFAILITLSFLAMSGVVIVGSMIVGQIAGVGITPVLGSADANAYADDFVLSLASTFVNLMLAATYAGIAAIFMSSTLGGAIVGVVITIADNGSLLLFGLLGSLFDMPRLIDIYGYLPGYNVGNIQGWLLNGQGTTIQLSPAYTMQPHPLEVSMLIIVSWFIGLLLLNILVFHYRDIG